METTLTLNDGTANVVYTHKNTEDGEVLWTSPSPQGDFDGVLKHNRKAVKSKTGILTRTSTTIVPRYNATSGQYEGFVQVRTTTSAASTVPTTFVEKAVNMHNAAFSTTANPTYRGEYSAGSDAL